MANKVTIDVEARFVDKTSSGAKTAAKSVDEIEKSAKRAEKEMDKLNRKKVKPKFEANADKLVKKLRDVDSKLGKIKGSKTEVRLSAKDKASTVIKKLLGSAKSFGGKTYSAMLKIRDSNALATINKINSGAKRFASKTWSAAVKIKDYATAPLTKIKNTLFSIKSLVLAITAGLAAKQLVANPIGLADQYSSAKIGFSTFLGEAQGQQMLNDLDAFAKATPFNSSQVISQTQRMLAMGWDSENIIKDMETIGDAAAATGKGEQGLDRIVTALAQIKTKGRTSTEELNQLAEAGISAKRYLAEGLGYGTGDKGIAKMTKDLEDGAIASDRALNALLSGMKEYQGMMDATANETVSGLKSQIADTFEINVFRRWGQGLQDGAKKSLGSVVSLLNEAEGALNEFGDMLYEIGSNVSNWLADKFEKAVERITDITGTFEFHNASLGEKISMLWNGVIVDPLKEWWEGGGQQKTAETAGKIGKWMGETLTSGLLTILGITDIFEDSGLDSSGGMSVAQSFAQGFVDGFDVSAITDKIVDAIGNVWNALPTWGKILLGGYGVTQGLGAVGNAIGGVANFIGGAKNVLGGFNIASSLYPHLTSSGSGILGVMGKAGVGLGASTTGSALLMGGAGIAGGAAAGATGIAAISNFYNARKAYESGDKIEGEASAVGGMTKLGGVAAGAAIGSIFGPVGTLVGAGVGGIAGWLGGNKWADSIRQAKYETEGLAEELSKAETEEEKAAAMSKAKWESAQEHFGDIKLSIQEIERLADQIVWGDDMGAFEKFSSATKNAEESLKSLKSASADTEKWMWKAGLGVKFNDDEKESIVASFDEYISSAKSFVENKHYEFTAAVDLLMDVNSKEGKSIIKSGDAFYTKIQEQLDGLGTKLSKKVDIALEDGVITLDEQKEIANLQQQIAEITDKIANSEQKAELELVKVKFGGGNLDYDSFETFMSTMQTTIDERMSANDDAFVASVSGLNLQLEEGAISQEEYDKQLQSLVEGYTATVDSLRAEVQDVELNIIGDAYKEELGKDAAEDLQNALQYAIDEGIDPVEISSDKLCELLNVDSLSEETASNIKDMLSGVLGQLEIMEVDGNLLLKIGEVEADGDTEEKVKESVPDTVEKTVGVDITGEKKIQNNIEILTEDFDIPEDEAAVISLLLTGDKQILGKVDTSALAGEFGIPKEKAENVIMKLQGSKSVQNKISVLSDDFGIRKEVAATIVNRLTGYKSVANKLEVTTDDFGVPESVAQTVTNKLTGIKSIQNSLSVKASDFGVPSSVNKTVTVNITGKKGSVSGIGIGKARGGIVGGSSSMAAFARGGIAGYTNGGMVRGGAQLVTVAEEGSPEMIIPLSSQRRGRALKLWAQAGHMMGVPGFARGGMVGDDSTSSIRNTDSRQVDGISSGSGNNITVDIGGVTIQIDANGYDGDIVAAIQSQKERIADAVAEIFTEELRGQFENTPTRGGGAA